MLAAARDPYVVLRRPARDRPALAARLPAPPFAVLGELFAPGRIDLGLGRAELGGLRRGDIAIRDAHPALWLVRARARAAGRASRSSPGRRPTSAAARGGGARPAGARRHPAAAHRRPGARPRGAARASLGPVPAAHAGLPLGVPPERLRAACRGRRRRRPDIALWMVAGLAPREPPTCAPPDLVLPWGGDPGPAAAAAAARLDGGLAACRFRDAAWFPALAAALDAAYDPAAGVAEAAGRRPAAARRAGALMPRAGRPARPRGAAASAWLEVRDRRAGRQLRPVHDRTAAIAPADILLVTCLRNERPRLPAFVDYYRRLGVGHFLVVDNGSSDGLMDWARASPTSRSGTRRRATATAPSACSGSTTSCAATAAATGAWSSTPTSSWSTR